MPAIVQLFVASICWKAQQSRLQPNNKGDAISNNHCTQCNVYAAEWLSKAACSQFRHHHDFKVIHIKSSMSVLHSSTCAIACNGTQQTYWQTKWAWTGRQNGPGRPEGQQLLALLLMLNKSHASSAAAHVL